MKKKSSFKRLGYASSALVLALASVPVIPVAGAYAASGGNCTYGAAAASSIFSTAPQTSFNLNICAEDYTGGSMSDSYIIDGGKNVTINLNEQTVDFGSSPAFIVKSGSTLVLEGAGTIGSSSTSGTIRNEGGTIIINGGTYSNNSNSGSGVIYSKYAARNSITINGGTFTGMGGTPIIYSYMRNVDNNITINDGTFNARYLTNTAQKEPIADKITINGGDFTGLTWKIDASATSVDATETKDAFDVYGGVWRQDPSKITNSNKIAYAGDSFYIVGDKTILTLQNDNRVVKRGDKVAIFNIAPATVSYGNYSVTNKVTVTKNNGSALPTGLTYTIEDGTGYMDSTEDTEAGQLRFKFVTLDGQTFKEDGEATTLRYFTPKAYSDKIVKSDASRTSVPKTDVSEDNVARLEYALSSSNDAIVSTDEHGFTPVAAGSAEITVTYNDANQSTETFTVYVYDFDTTEETVFLGKGETVDIAGDSSVTATTEYTEAAPIRLTQNGTGYTISGEEVGNKTITIKTTIGEDPTTENLEKKVNVYVYEPTTDVYVKVNGESARFVDFNSEAGDGKTLSIKDPSALDGIATFDYDGGLTGTLNAAGAGKKSLTYKLTDGANDSGEISANVFAYEEISMDDLVIPVGKEISLKDFVKGLSDDNKAEFFKVKIGDSEELVDLSDATFEAEEAREAEVSFYLGNGDDLGTSAKIKTYVPATHETIYLNADASKNNNSAKVSLEGMPEYELASDNESLVSVEGDKVVANAAGEINITITYKDSLYETDDKTTTTFAVKAVKLGAVDVSESHIALGDKTTISIADENPNAVISTTNSDVVKNDDGTFTFTGSTPKENEISFTETLDDHEYPENAFTVTIYVHDLTVTSDADAYILAEGEDEAVTVSATTNYGNIVAVVKDDEGEPTDNVSVNAGEDGIYTISSTEAGTYTLHFENRDDDGNTIIEDGNEIKIYVIDFTVDPTKLIIEKGESERFITAINKYFKDIVVENAEENAASVELTYGEVTDEDTHKVYPLTSSLNAGNYILNFYAKVNGEKVTKTLKPVEIQVYEFVTPDEDKKAMTVGDEWTITVKDNNDKGNVRLSEDGTSTNYEIEDHNDGTWTITATNPGTYNIEFVDYASDETTQIGEPFTATIEVYDLIVTDEYDNDLEDGATVVIEDYEDLRDYVKVSTAENGSAELTLKDDKGDTINLDNEETLLAEGTYTAIAANAAAKAAGITSLSRTYTVYVVSVVENTVATSVDNPYAASASNSTWSTDEIKAHKIGIVDEGGEVSDLIETTEDGYILQATAPGVYEVIELHHFGSEEELYAVAYTTVIVYDTKADITDTDENAANTLAGVIEDLAKMFSDDLTEEEYEELASSIAERLGEDFIADGTLFGIGSTILSGESFVTRVTGTDEKVTPSDEAKEAIEAKLAGYDIDGIDYYNINVEVDDTLGNQVALLHKLDDAVTVAIAVGNDPEGYNRVYYVVRYHNGEAEIIAMATADEDGYIYFESDLFSEYGIAYRDTLRTAATPNTGSATKENASATSSVLISVLATLAIITLAGIVKFAKRK